MNPDYSSLFQSLLRLSQSIDDVRDRLNSKHQAVRHQAACHGKTQWELKKDVLSAKDAEKAVRAMIADLTGRLHRQAKLRNNLLPTQIAAYEQGLRVRQAEVAQHRQTLADWNEKLARAKAEFAVFEEESLRRIRDAARQMAVLRDWGKKMGFADLSDEVLVLVLDCLDYVDQQRLTRVCHRWRYVITTDIDHIYLDWPAVARERRLGDYRTFHDYYTKCGARRLLSVEKGRAQILPWSASKPSFSRIRRITFPDGFRPVFAAVFCDLFRLVKQCPNLSVLTLHQSALDGLAQSMVKCGFIDYWEGSPEIQVKLVDCVVAAFSVDYSISRFRARLLGDQLARYVPVTDVLLVDPSQFITFLADDQLAWPYPVEQIAWLKEYAPCLNVLPEVMSALKTLSSSSSTHKLLCPVHNELCSHLDQVFYDKLTGTERNLLAACLLKQQPGKVPPSPVAFGFKRLTLKGKESTVVASTLGRLHFSANPD